MVIIILISFCMNAIIFVCISFHESDLRDVDHQSCGYRGCTDDGSVNVFRFCMYGFIPLFHGILPIIFVDDLLVTRD